VEKLEKASQGGSMNESFSEPDFYRNRRSDAAEMFASAFESGALVDSQTRFGQHAVLKAENEPSSVRSGSISPSGTSGGRR
jgi:hypothetical protein